MTATFDNTVSILVKAYLNGTLRHGDCYACAVGNIIAASIGCGFIKARDHINRNIKYEWFKDGQYYEPIWPDVFCTLRTGKQEKHPSSYKGVRKLQIDITGYSWQDLARIENAFETVDEGGSNDEYMFNGLMAVVDVLADIHSVDLSLKEQAKQLFVKV